MRAPAFLTKSEGATDRAERALKTLRAPPRPAANVPDPIDAQIAALLESVTASPDTSGAEPDATPVRVAAERPPAARASAQSSKSPAPTARAAQPRARIQARTVRTRTPRRPRRTARHVLSDTSFRLPRPYLFYNVRQAFDGFTYALPRPYLSYMLRRAFWWIAIMLFSVAVGFLLVYLMST